MHSVLRTAVTLLLTTTTTLLPAQGSGYSTGGIELSPRVSTSYLAATLTDASRETRWLQFVVLWRGQSGWSRGQRGLDTAMLRRAETEYNTARRAALGRDGLFVGGQSGGVAYTAEADSARRTLTVLGQRFSIPRSDSALIVMVDRIDGVGGDPIVAATTVVESRLPDLPAERTWTSGDTTFIVRPRGRGPESDRANIEAVLGRDSTVAAFWRVGGGPLGGPTDVLVPNSPRTVTLASPAEFQPDLAAVDGPFECSGPEAIGQSAMGRRLVGARRDLLHRGVSEQIGHESHGGDHGRPGGGNHSILGATRSPAPPRRQSWQQRRADQRGRVGRRDCCRAIHQHYDGLSRRPRDRCQHRRRTTR